MSRAIRTEFKNLSASRPEKVKELAARAKRCGVVPSEELLDARSTKLARLD